MKPTRFPSGALLLLCGLTFASAVLTYSTVSIAPQWTNQSTGTDEIVAYDPTTDRYFVVNPPGNRVDVPDGDGNNIDSIATSTFGPANRAAASASSPSPKKCRARPLCTCPPFRCRTQSHCSASG